MGTAAVVGEGAVSFCRNEVTGGHSRNTRALVDCLVYQMKKQAQGEVGMGDALVLVGTGQQTWAVIPLLCGLGPLPLSLHFHICKYQNDYTCEGRV